MSESAVEVWLVRHGETEWSRSGQHTGKTDLPLNEAGVEDAKRLTEVLSGVSAERVLASPLQRAWRTAELAGFLRPDAVDDLVEWDYGDYEGRTRAEVHEERPDWSVWTDGTPGGESPADVSDRVDRVIAGCRDAGGRSLLFAHGHILRALAARWIEQPVAVGAHLPLQTAKIGVLGYDRGTPTIDRWNADS